MNEEGKPPYRLEADGKASAEGNVGADGWYRGKPETHDAARVLLRDPSGPKIVRLIDSTERDVEIYQRGITTHIGGRPLDNPQAAKDAARRKKKAFPKGA